MRREEKKAEYLTMEGTEFHGREDPLTPTFVPFDLKTYSITLHIRHYSFSS